MRDLDELFAALTRSRFRSRFRLKGKELAYLREQGLQAVCEHARRFIVQRLGAARPENDGRQTPMRGHPVFIAQHATGTCCRSCLQKWHRLAPGRALSDAEVDYVVAVLRAWLMRQCPDAPERQPTLFPGA